MLKDITLGQYFPGDSFVHKLDPRTKLLMVFLYIIALFLANGFVGYGVMIAVTGLFIALSKVPLKAMFRGLKAVILIIVLTAVLNMFYTDGNVLVQVWKLKITDQGLIKALFMVLRIVMLICGTFLLTYTTAPVALTDGMELLLNPLKKLKVPVHEMSMMMSMALRFIPTLIEETDKIISAQKARGADFETGSLIDRAKALLPILVPLFISAFRRADELAIAMESRCYNGGAGRTRMKQLRFKGSDYLALTFGVLLIGGMIALQVVGL